MTKEEIVEAIYKIKEKCSKYGSSCDNCPFDNGNADGSHCQLVILAREFLVNPTRWDVEKIKEIL